MINIHLASKHPNPLRGDDRSPPYFSSRYLPVGSPSAIKKTFLAKSSPGQFSPPTVLLVPWISLPRKHASKGNRKFPAEQLLSSGNMHAGFHRYFSFPFHRPKSVQTRALARAGKLYGEEIKRGLVAGKFKNSKLHWRKLSREHRRGKKVVTLERGPGCVYN